MYFFSRRSIVSLLCGAKEDFQSQGEGKGEDKKHYVSIQSSKKKRVHVFRGPKTESIQRTKK